LPRIGTIGRVIGILGVIIGLAAVGGGITLMMQVSSMPGDIEAKLGMTVDEIEGSLKIAEPMSVEYASLKAADSALASSSTRWWLGIENLILGGILIIAGIVIYVLIGELAPLIGVLSGFTGPPQA
jgi:hypothetical protein